MRMLWRRRRPTLVAIVTGLLVFVLSACAAETEPSPAPIVARSLGGDSARPGPMIIICQADDVGCVPTYAVACKLTWMGDSTQRLYIPPLSPREQAWCAEQQEADTNSP